MSTMRTDEMKNHGRWRVPALCVVFAIAYAAVFLAHHRPALAAAGAGVMLVYGAALVIFSKRSEAVALLRDDTPDERRRMITTKAAANTLYLVVAVSLIMLFVQLARGMAPGAWGVICAVGGFGFIVSVIWESRRS